MPRIAQQKHFQRVQRELTFCYLCGKPLDGSQAQNRDHVPPRKAFDANHRNNPLVLPTHTICNSNQSKYDEFVSQLTGLLRGKFPRKGPLNDAIQQIRKSKMRADFAVIKGENLKRIVYRWVKGFHAALYGEYLESGIKANVHLPFPSGYRQDGQDLWEPLLPQRDKFAEELRIARLAKLTDRVCCYSGQCLYECIWVKTDDGQWMCVFGLRLHGWEVLCPKSLPRRACVGFYLPVDGKPATASKQTGLALPITVSERLDPFI